MKRILKFVVLISFLKLRQLYYNLKLFCTKRNILDKTYHSFADYERLINDFYEEPQNLVIGKISKSLLDDIKSNFCDEVTFQKENNILQSSNDIHPVLDITRFENDIISNLKKNIVAGDMHLYDYSNKILKNLHDELREMFSTYIASPFIFVNTRIWKTKANSANYGPNSMHTDGFMPGHMKIMIYVTPLNEDYGTFIYKDKNGKICNISNKPEGTTILFRNSDVLHSGNPGKTYDRISIECTLMRSIINGNQNWPGHWFGRHFKHPKQIEIINE